MLFGLFKSRKARSDAVIVEQLQLVIDTVELFDARQRALMLLECSSVRMAEMAALGTVDRDLLLLGGPIWYAPLTADQLSMLNAARKFSNLVHKITENAKLVAGDSQAQAALLILDTAFRTWCVTWYVSLQPEFIPQAEQMWRLIATGIPTIEAMTGNTEDPAVLPLTPKERERYAQALADGPDGPDYRRIPTGFGPADPI